MNYNNPIIHSVKKDNSIKHKGHLTDNKKKYLGSFLSHPWSFFFLSFLEACEAFSFYGFTSLLILFMTKALEYSEAQAFGIFALYMAMTEVFSIIGGIIADRFFGFKKCVMAGYCFMFVGYLLIPFLPFNLFYIGIGFIVMGSGLFASNSTTLVGLCYNGIDDPQLERGFTIYYASLNLGACIALIGCGLVVEKYGWAWSFGIAALGIFIGTLFMFCFHKILPENDKKPLPKEIKYGALITAIIASFIFALCLYYYDKSSNIMLFILVGSLAYLLKEWFCATPSEKKNIITIFFLTLLLAVFFAVDEQSRSSLVLFSEHHVDNKFLGWSVPVSSIAGINPLWVVLLFPLFYMSLGKTHSYKRDMNKIIIGFILLTLAFTYLLWISYGNSTISIYNMFFVLAVIALSELFVGPVIYFLCAKLSPAKIKGSMMGLVTIGYGFANHFAGYISQIMVIPNNVNKNASMDIYTAGFKTIAFLLIATTIITAVWKLLSTKR